MRVPSLCMVHVSWWVWEGVSLVFAGAWWQMKAVLGLELSA